ncbi:MAG: CPBP family intramembrane metalloprotease [Bacteroidales bacterium]|nr:CPBP family intramembrane metalloprotease [Bacteroidales bacterium]
MKNNYFNYHIPSLKQSWGLVLVFIAASVLASPIQVVTNGLSIPYAVSFLLIFGWVLLQGKICFNAGGLPLRINMPDFGKMNPVSFFVILALVVLSIGVLVEPIASLIPMPDAIKELFEKVFDSEKPMDLVVSTTLLAPICEELFCRGLILRGLLARISPTKAILWSAFIFAFIHMNPWQAIPAFALGCFFGWIYYRTHSIWACIFMHFVNNGMSSLMMLILPDMETDATFAEVLSAGNYAALLAVSAAVLVGGIILLNKKLKSNEEIISFKVQANTQE